MLSTGKTVFITMVVSTPMVIDFTMKTASYRVNSMMVPCERG